MTVFSFIMADETRSGRVLSVVGIFFSTFISYLACMRSHADLYASLDYRPQFREDFDSTFSYAFLVDVLVATPKRVV